MPNLEPKTAVLPAIVYHVGHEKNVLKFAEIDPLDAELMEAGNRFDVVGSGVLYAATEKVGSYKETIAWFRPAASSVAYGAAPHFMMPGALPAEWRDNRRMVSFGLSDPLPFLDVEQDETLSYLTEQMSDTLTDLKIPRLDSSLIRGPNRLLTRAIATWAYTKVDADDEAVYSGIRYSSKFQSHECWAIFDGVVIGNSNIETIPASDLHLAAAARALNITIH